MSVTGYFQHTNRAFALAAKHRGEQTRKRTRL
jgi:hypothetical protein